MFRNFIQLFSKRKSVNSPLVPEEADRLPEKMPDDFKVMISSAGTFSMQSESMLVENNSVHIKNESKDRSRQYDVRLGSHQIENMYRILKENKFDRIKTDETISLDHPSHSIFISWGNSFILKGESQSKCIHKKWEHVYRNCRFDLIEVLRKAIKSHLKPLKITLDDALSASKYKLTIISADSLTPYYYQKGSGILSAGDSLNQSNSRQPDEFMFLPGYSILVIEWAKNSHSVKYNLLLPAADSASLTIYLRKDDLQWSITTSP